LASHKSAWKRIRQNAKRNARNVHFKTFMKTRVRRVREAISSGQADAAREALVKAMSAIDHVASKGVIHRNSASRKVARLSRAVFKAFGAAS
jgi:small subunit ribosomal protein S20